MFGLKLENEYQDVIDSPQSGRKSGGADLHAIHGDLHQPPDRHSFRPCRRVDLGPVRDRLALYFCGGDGSLQHALCTDDPQACKKVIFYNKTQLTLLIFGNAVI